MRSWGPIKKGRDMANGEREELVPDDGSPTAAPHPEEMKATIEFRAGKSISLIASSRATPAGLAMAALLVSAVLIPLVLITRQFRRRELSRPVPLAGP